MIFTVKQARRMADLSQGKVADKLGVTTATYAKYERNPAKMRIDTAIKFSQVVGIPIDQIFFGTNLPKVEQTYDRSTHNILN